MDDNGAVTIASYINNVHPVRHAALYRTIASVFSKFLPLLEQAITDSLHPREPRVAPNLEFVPIKTKRRQMVYYERYESESDPECQDFPDYDTYLASRDSIFDPPQPKPFVTPSRPKISYKLSGRRL